MPADQFIVSIHCGEESVYQSVLGGRGEREKVGGDQSFEALYVAIRHYCSAVATQPEGTVSNLNSCINATQGNFCSSAVRLLRNEYEKGARVVNSNLNAQQQCSLTSI